MKRINYFKFLPAAILFLAFFIFTALLCFVDIAPIGPNGSEIGFATINGAIFDTLGQNDFFYSISEITIYLAILVAAAFASLGAYQLIKRKKLFAVDKTILWLGVIYALAIFFYIAFEIVVIGYRPVLIDGELEAAFPSSHTMLVSTILISAIFAFNKLVRSLALRVTVSVTASIITAVTIVFRLLSGVHWFTDIVGGILLSAALVMLYYALLSIKTKEE